MNKRIFSQSLKKRLVGITLFFTLSIAALTATYGYFSYRSILNNSLKQTTSGNLKFLAETIQFDLNAAINLADVSATNDAVITWLNASNAGQSKTSMLAYTAWKRIEEEYRNNTSKININRILISDLNQHFIILGSKEITHMLPISKTIKEQPFFQKLYESKKRIETGFIEDPLTPFSKSNWALPIIRPVYSFYGRNEAGWCCLFLPIMSSLKSLIFQAFL